jgi:hypothetical protein
MIIIVVMVKANTKRQFLEIAQNRCFKLAIQTPKQSRLLCGHLLAAQDMKYHMATNICYGAIGGIP